MSHPERGPHKKSADSNSIDFEKEMLERELAQKSARLGKLVSPEARETFIRAQIEIEQQRLTALLVKIKEQEDAIAALNKKYSVQEKIYDRIKDRGEEDLLDDYGEEVNKTFHVVGEAEKVLSELNEDKENIESHLETLRHLTLE